MDGQIKLTLNCKDRFNKVHNLENVITIDKTLNKAVINNLRVFQTEVNALMTELVEVEKKEFPRQQNNKNSKKEDEESEDESSSASEDEINKKEDESPDVKKLKTI